MPLDGNGRVCHVKKINQTILILQRWCALLDYADLSPTQSADVVVLHNECSLTGVLLVKVAISFFSLLKVPLMSKETVNV